MGDQILSGKVLYRDLWAHRGPVVFFINALGVLFTPGSLWGIWMIESAFIFFASILSYRLINNLYGKLPAVLTTSLWLSYFTLVRSLNFSENYYVLFQFLLLYLFQKAGSSENRRKYDFWIGVAAALGFMIRANMVVITIVIILLWLWQMVTTKKFKEYLQTFLFAGLGAFTVIGGISIYLISNGAFSQFIEQAFLFNFSYFGGDSLTFVSAIEYANNRIDFVLPFSIAGWLISIIWLVGKFKDNIKVNRSILLFTIIYFPIEIYFTGISGIKYVHYLVPLFAGVALLSGFLFYLLLEHFPKTAIWRSQIKLNQVIICSLFAGFIFFPMIEHYTYSKIATYNLLKKKQTHYREYSKSTVEILDYIEANTSPDDIVYFWGIELSYNFISGRESLGKYWNAKIFVHDDYINNGLVTEFEQELLRTKPLIFDPSPEYDYVIPLVYGNSGLTGVDQIQEFIREHYVRVGTIESNGWFIFKFVEE